MNIEEIIKVIFSDIDIDIQKIPESDSKTPDYIIFDGKDRYLLELKSKFGNPKISVLRDSILSKGELFDLSLEITPQNRLSGVISSGKKQLDAYSSEKNIYRLLWLHCQSYIGEAHFEQFHSTLYGASTLIDWNEDGKSGTAYFIYNSDFFRYKDSIDAAFISTNSKFKLCLNPLSPKYQSIKLTNLIHKLSDGVEDPIEIESEGKGFIVDANFDRSNQDIVLDYLKKKYGLSDLTKIMDMNYHSGTVLVENENGT